MEVVEESRSYNQPLSKIVRTVILIAMLVQTCYILTAHFILNGEILLNAGNFNLSAATWTISLIYMSIGIIQFLLKPKTKSSLIITLIIYYIATISFSVIVGYNEISWALWLILLTITGFLLNKKYFFASVCLSFFAYAADIFLLRKPNELSIFSLIFSLIFLWLIAFLIVKLRELGALRSELYNELKIRERIQSGKLTTIINSIDNAIINIDSQGKIQLYNAAVLSLLDTNASLMNRKIDDVFNLENEEGEKISLIKLSRENKKPIHRDDIILIGDEKINLSLELAPITTAFGQNDNPGTIAIMRDITKQRSLDDERDEFISVVSHELRTPVAIAEGSLSNLQFLLEKNADNKTFSKTLNAAHDQILYLGQIVNDLSTLSRAQRGVYMDPEDIDVKSFMNELYNKYLPEAQKHKLSLDLDIQANGTISVARMAIEEMMQNLIMNAIKYTAKGGVTITVHNVKKGANKSVKFEIKDTGIGISKSDQKHIFQRFWRSEDYRTRETSGTGLGLHVVRQLADKIGTEVKLTSRINHGSTFSFILPLK